MGAEIVVTGGPISHRTLEDIRTIWATDARDPESIIAE